MLLSWRPLCIKFNLLKNGSQSFPCRDEFAITMYETAYLERSTCSTDSGTRLSHWDFDTALAV